MSTNYEAGANEDFDYQQHEHDFLDHMSSQPRDKGPNDASATDAEEAASINDYDLRSIPNMEHLLLTKLHNRFKFPDRDESKTPWDDDAVTDINAAAMVKFSNALSAWKVRVKRLIEKNTPLSKIFAENPSLTEAEFLKFKDTCATDEAKLRSAKFKGLQKMNTGKHRLGSRGYIGKKPIWDKEDAEREAAGIPDPLAEFTDPQEYDFIRARYKWNSKKKVWSTDETGN